MVESRPKYVTDDFIKVGLMFYINLSIYGKPIRLIKTMILKEVEVDFGIVLKDHAVIV